MAVEQVGQLTPVMAFALVGGLGVGSQWLAWRLRMPAIVLMLLAGVVVGPVLGLFDPARDIGPLVGAMISIAVAIILFEGGMTLNFRSLLDAAKGVRRLVFIGAPHAAKGVRRLVFIGAPLGWLLSALTLHFAAGLSWETSAVFGGIMIVTGPTVIAPLLRQARLSRRPAALLQWEAIVNDPIGALAAVLAFEVVVVLNTTTGIGSAVQDMVDGIVLSALLGAFSGIGLSIAFKGGRVPEYMKVPVLFVVLLGAFALSDSILHESGLLAVTLMGIVIANANLPSYVELRRFKEQATILLVSGVFILLAASLDVAALARLDVRAVIFVAAVVLIARPLTVFVSLFGSGVPWREQVLVAFTGPRGVVLVAVAGLFGTRLDALGIPDGNQIGPLAFVLVAVTVVLHGFTLAPFARLLGLTGGARPGVMIVGGSGFTLGLAQALTKAEVQVLIADPNHGHLRAARSASIPTFSGDILSEAAEHRLEWVGYQTILVATDNDAYNTLVATDLAPEFGRDNVFQVTREKSEMTRHQLPRTLGGRPFGADETWAGYERLIADGWVFRVTRLTEEFGLEDWRRKRPNARLLVRVSPSGDVRFPSPGADVVGGAEVRLISLLPPGAQNEAEAVPAAPDAAAALRR